MLEEMIKTVIKKTIYSDYPHLQAPAIMLASVDTGKRLARDFEYKDVTLRSKSGEISQVDVFTSWYEYSLTVVDRFGNPDNNFPPLPGIVSKKQFRTGAIIAIALPYGELSPVIIGEVIL